MSLKHQLVREIEAVPGGLAAVSQSRAVAIDRTPWLLLAQQRRWNPKVLLPLLDSIDEALFADDSADEPDKDYADD